MNQKTIIAIILFLLLTLAIGVIVFVSFKPAIPVNNANSVPQTLEGAVQEIDINNKVVTLDSTEAGEVQVEYSSETQFVGVDGNAILPSSLQRGFTLKVIGVFAQGNVFEAQNIFIQKEPNIIVYEPEASSEAGLPLHIEGIARVFENTLNYRIKDGDGTELVEGFTQALSQDTGLYGSFEADIYYPRPTSTEGTLEVFIYSAQDGSEIEKVIVPLRFKHIEDMIVRAYFGNSKFDPNIEDCSRVYSVDRRVPKNQNSARAALEQLLLRTTVGEKEEGYFTSINDGVEIQSLTIENSEAKADFDTQLEFQVGGSCRVQAIRAQITETLKQFPSVKNVTLSIDGRTEDILQP